MNKDLQYLAKLQQIDQRIFELNQSKEQFPLDVERLSKEIADVELTVSSIEKKNEDIAREKKNIKEQMEKSTGALDKSSDRLNAITTNREYDAIHAEIDQHKHIISNGESRLKSFSQDTEQLGQQKEEALKKVELIRAENQPKIDELHSKIASIDSDIAAEVRARDALTPLLGRQYLRTYEHIRRRRKNARVLSMVSVADRTCSICHKILEAQLINEVRKSLRLQICESCGSILVWAAEEVMQEMPVEQKVTVAPEAAATEHDRVSSMQSEEPALEEGPADGEGVSTQDDM